MTLQIRKQINQFLKLMINLLIAHLFVRSVSISIYLIVNLQN